MFNTIYVKTSHMIWRSRGHDKLKKNQMTKGVFNFQYRKGIIMSESKFFCMNLLNKFCTLWKVLLLWMNSNIFYLNHVYNAVWWGFTWQSAFKLLIIFRGVRSYKSSSNFHIHHCFLNLCSKAYHDLLSVCPCETSISKTSP